MGRLSALLLLLMPLVGMSAGNQYDYAYRSTAWDVSYADMSSSSSFSSFKSEMVTKLVSANVLISAGTLTNTTPPALGSTTSYSVSFPSGPTLASLVRIPSSIDSTKPVIYVFSAWGNAANETMGALFQADGYIVVEIQYQSWYAGLSALYTNYGYLPVWGVVAHRVAEAIDQILPSHSGYSIVSSATGSLVTPFFVLYHQTPKAIVTNGVLLSLDWLRRNYRYPGTPNIWDLGYVDSYTPVFMTMACIPMQFQIGTADSFYPDVSPISPSSPYTGSDRGQTLDESYGQYLLLEKSWHLSGTTIELSKTAMGHLEPDYTKALVFIQAH